MDDRNRNVFVQKKTTHPVDDVKLCSESYFVSCLFKYVL